MLCNSLGDICECRDVPQSVQCGFDRSRGEKSGFVLFVVVVGGFLKSNKLEAVLLKCGDKFSEG